MKVTIRHAPAAFASAKRECGANYAYICEVVTSYRHMAVTPVKGLMPISRNTTLTLEVQWPLGFINIKMVLDLCLVTNELSEIQYTH